MAQQAFELSADVAGLLSASLAFGYAAVIGARLRRGQDGGHRRGRRLRRNSWQAKRRRPISDAGGGAAMEFALVAPVLVMLLIGIVTYGGWLWMAQSVETLAGEAARASLAGLDPAERELLARREVQEQAPRLMGVRPSDLTVTVEADPARVLVRINYDVSRNPMLAMRGLVPSPPSRIERTAVVRLGGY